MKLANEHPLDGVFRLSDHALLFRSRTADATLVSHVLKISGAPNRDYAGVVFELTGSYSGYEKEALWEWLKETRSFGWTREFAI